MREEISLPNCLSSQDIRSVVGTAVLSPAVNKVLSTSAMSVYGLPLGLWGRVKLTFVGFLKNVTNR